MSDPIQDAAARRVEISDPSLMDRFLAWIRSLGSDQQQPASQGVADAMNAQLPDAVSARPAIIEAARRRQKLIPPANDR